MAFGRISILIMSRRFRSPSTEKLDELDGVRKHFLARGWPFFVKRRSLSPNHLFYVHLPCSLELLIIVEMCAPHCG